MRQVHCGFTLIELLVVISILLILLGLIMPLIGMADREARKSATRTVMAKVDTALRLFRSELGPYPYQQTYADIGSGAAWTNRLFYHLGTDISDADRQQVMADANAAAALYAYQGASPHAYRNAQMPFYGGSGSLVANRMARERVRLAIISGHIKVTGGVLVDLTLPALPTGALLVSPLSAARSGWAKDYLRGELSARHVDGEAILDAWRRPIIYVCQVVEGMRTAAISYSDTVCLGLKANQIGLHPQGRRTLAPIDAYDAKPLVSNPPALPDLNDLRRSDRRLYAPRTLELEFELWSAGPNGRADWMRDAADNRDNIAPLNYDKGIP